MTHILTFVASSTPLADSHIRQARDIAKYYNIDTGKKPVWLAKNKAADLALAQAPGSTLLTHIRDELNNDGIDVFISPEDGRRKKLLLADMDSTIVTTETLDELAEHAGIKEKIALITQAAMEGKLDFHTALRERVALLKGLPVQKLQDTLDQTKFSAGAISLVQTMKKHGATCILVSGGFTFFTGSIASKAGFDNHHGNTLETAFDKLTGKVEEPILDKFAKLDFLKKYTADLNITMDAALTIGDGANDIPMLKAAGLGVGYKPKSAVAQEVNNLIVHGDLTAALYAQGYKNTDFII